jgi:hypothetical protein
MAAKTAKRPSALATLRKLSPTMRSRIVDFLDDVLWADYETTGEAMADAEKKLKPDMTPGQWKALDRVLKVVLPILLGLIK